MPRFVILEHDHPERHWDLLLEAGEVLRTWRLMEAPRVGSAVRAEPSFDHRTLYLDYEGPISGGRGTVVAWDRGTFEAESGLLEPGRTLLTVRLQGERLCGVATLARDEAGEWSFRVSGEEG
ncbi:MAG: hypothetical protein L0Z62_10385 [Gemmataceae bacterium]|nr:hypothetical protein [Gemmataceae bacterium]